MERTIETAYGSLALYSVLTEEGPFYVPGFSSVDQNQPRFPKKKRKTILFIEGVNAIMHGSRLWELCREASGTNPRISESKLKEKVTKLVIKRKCS